MIKTNKIFLFCKTNVSIRCSMITAFLICVSGSVAYCQTNVESDKRVVRDMVSLDPEVLLKDRSRAWFVVSIKPDAESGRRYRGLLVKNGSFVHTGKANKSSIIYSGTTQVISLAFGEKDTQPSEFRYEVEQPVTLYNGFILVSSGIGNNFLPFLKSSLALCQITQDKKFSLDSSMFLLPSDWEKDVKPFVTLYRDKLSSIGSLEFQKELSGDISSSNRFISVFSLKKLLRENYSSGSKIVEEYNLLSLIKSSDKMQQAIDFVLLLMWLRSNDRQMVVDQVNDLVDRSDDVNLISGLALGCSFIRSNYAPRDYSERGYVNSVVDSISMRIIDRASKMKEGNKERGYIISLLDKPKLSRSSQ